MFQQKPPTQKNIEPSYRDKAIYLAVFTVYKQMDQFDPYSWGATHAAVGAAAAGIYGAWAYRRQLAQKRAEAERQAYERERARLAARTDAEREAEEAEGRRFYKENFQQLDKFWRKRVHYWFVDQDHAWIPDHLRLQPYSIEIKLPDKFAAYFRPEKCTWRDLNVAKADIERQIQTVRRHALL